MKALQIYDQPEAIMNGEAYMRITPDTVGTLILNTYDPDHPRPLDDQEAWKFAQCDRRPMLHQWLEIGLARFAPFTHVEIIDDRMIHHRRPITSIEVRRPRFQTYAVRPDIECFVIRFEK